MPGSERIFKPQQSAATTANVPVAIEQFLGGGGQGEVYRATLGGKPLALKWYFKENASPQQKAALETLIKRGAPTPRFLWPMDLVTSPAVAGFGYLMPLREPRYRGLVELMTRQIDPSFQALISACLELSHSFLQLHARGLCYRDINFGNVFLDSENGDILICDNDNVTVNGAQWSGVIGTPRFMAPEIVRGTALPDTQTDLYSLSVLLFYMLMLAHPLEGRREAGIHALDLAAMNRIYGSEPVFIFDPADDSNRPVPGIHDNALTYWGLYPQFLRDLFTRAFTAGLREPRDRVRENEWRGALANLRDWVLYCPNCGAENFYDPESLRKNNGQPRPCWSCDGAIRLPYRVRIDKTIVLLNHDSRLYPHHIDPQRPFDFSAPAAEMVQHPQDPAIWGLKNRTGDTWRLTLADGSVKTVEPGRSAQLAVGVRIHFGKCQGEIRY